MKYLSLKILISRYSFFIVFFFASLYFFFLPKTIEADFSLDTSFGLAGKVITSFDGNNSYSFDLVTQSDGKIIVVGFASNGNHNNWVIVRYNTDGSIDNTFGLGGKVVQDFGYNNKAKAVALRRDGKIIVGGSDPDAPGGQYWTIAQYNTNGTLDSGFGNGGIVTTNVPLNGGTLTMLDLKIDYLGRIITVCYNGGYTLNSDLVLVRYNSEGTLDDTFGNFGIVRSRYDGSLNDAAHTVTIQDDGKIILFGEYAYGGPASLILLRYNQNGSLDNTFGTDGIVTEQIGYHNHAGEVKIQSDGKILIGGSYYVNYGSYPKIFVIRYNSDGSHDNSFGIGGYSLNPFDDELSSNANSIDIFSDGKILIGGDSGVNPNDSFEVWRLSTNGFRDNSFGNNGTIMTSIPGQNSSISEVNLESDSKIIVTGGTCSSFCNWGLLQYIKDNVSKPNLSVPSLKQYDLPWGIQVYDSALRWSPLNPYIARWGCALTSAAMVLKYYGINSMPGGLALDPGLLNLWLKNEPDGYVGNGLVNWLAVSRLSKQAVLANNIVAFDALEYTNVTGENKSSLLTDLEQQIPGILEVNPSAHTSHFVVAKGTTANSFTINDPAQEFNSDTLLDRYNNHFSSYGKLVPAQTDLSYIMFVASPSVSLTLKDDFGNTVANSFIQHPFEDDTARGSAPTGDITMLYYPKPATGGYTLTITGVADGVYRIESYLYDTNGEVQMFSLDGFIQNGSSDSLHIEFNRIQKDLDRETKIASFDSTIKDLDEAFALGLIDNNPYHAIRAAIEGAKRHSEAARKTQALQRLTDAMEKLTKERGSNVDENAYQILSYDIEYLISKP